MAIGKHRALTERKCKQGIIAEYLRYTTGQESPMDFHMWTCIGLIAIAMGRNAWYNRGAWNIYPNLYIVLVGESALVRKSTALSMGVRPLTEALPELEGLGQKITPEALIGVLADKCAKDESTKAEAFIHASEMSVLLGKSKLDDSLLKLMTDLWDCPDSHTYQTRGRGKEMLREVCINMLAGTTPDWLKNSVPEESLEGGFFSRLILVQRPATGEKNPFPEDAMNVGSRDARANIMHDLKIVHTLLQGQFEWELEAKKAYANWYCEYNSPENAQSFMRGYYGRKGDFVIKIAMISSANFSNDRKITKEDVMFAVKILNENEIFTKELVRFMGTTISGKIFVAVRNRIKRHVVSYTDGKGNIKQVVGIGHSELMRGMGHQIKANELSDVIEALVQAEEIEIFYDGNRKLYKLMASGQMLEDIKKELNQDG
jgi:hypothetical protein